MQWSSEGTTPATVFKQFAKVAQACTSECKICGAILSARVKAFAMKLLVQVANACAASIKAINCKINLASRAVMSIRQKPGGLCTDEC